MSNNRIRLIFICLLANFVMSGLFTPIGLITAAAAQRYNIDIVKITSQFTFFNGGIFIGYILSLFVFDYFKTKTIITFCSFTGYASILIIHITNNLVVLSSLLCLIGLVSSVIVCSAGAIISHYWTGYQRQSIFISQDATFNGGGYFFTFITTYFITYKFMWDTTYLFVGHIMLLVILLVLFSNFDVRKKNK